MTTRTIPVEPSNMLTTYGHTVSWEEYQELHTYAQESDALLAKAQER